MKKVTKKKQIEDLQTVVAAQWRQINKLKLHLGRLVDIDWSDEQADHDTVIDILDRTEPKLKQLDQSVFDGLDEKWRFAAVDESGKAFVYDGEPESRGFVFGLSEEQDGANDYCGLGDGYDTTNWQNSLIERKELTGSDLTEQIMKNQKYQPAFVSDESEQDALNSQRTALIDNVYMSDRDYRFRAELAGYRYAVAINNQGEPLTQSDVGL